MHSGEPTQASLALEFHVFDTLADAPAIHHQSALDRICAELPPALRRVETVSLNTPAEMDRHYRRCLAAGYESQMLRDPAARYAPLRRADQAQAVRGYGVPRHGHPPARRACRRSDAD